MNTINVSGFNKSSVTDGPGLRFVIFAQGCIHNCPECHNPDTHAFGSGIDYTAAEIYSMIKRNSIIKGVTFSGGEPFCQAEGFFALAQLLKADGYEIACYSGFCFEELVSDTNSSEYSLLSSLDILIDSKFLISQKSLSLKFKGSSNQRTIDVPLSLAQGDIVLSSSPRWV